MRAQAARWQTRAGRGGFSRFRINSIVPAPPGRYSLQEQGGRRAPPMSHSGCITLLRRNPMLRYATLVLTLGLVFGLAAAHADNKDKEVTLKGTITCAKC